MNSHQVQGTALLYEARREFRAEGRMLRIVLADSCPTTRKGLKQVLGRIRDCRVIGETATAIELFELLPKSRFDVLILDTELEPPAASLSLLERIVRAFPKKSVLVYTADGNPHLAIAAMQAGAACYLPKDTSTKEVVEAVKAVAGGGRYLARRIEHALAWLRIHQQNPNRPLESLSHRERQVFDGLAAGKRAKEIAGDLSLHAKTISCYRARLLKKLRLKNNADLVRFALTLPSCRSRPKALTFLALCKSFLATLQGNPDQSFPASRACFPTTKSGFFHWKALRLHLGSSRTSGSAFLIDSLSPNAMKGNTNEN